MVDEIEWQNVKITRGGEVIQIELEYMNGGSFYVYIPKGKNRILGVVVVAVVQVIEELPFLGQCNLLAGGLKRWMASDSASRQHGVYGR